MGFELLKRNAKGLEYVGKVFVGVVYPCRRAGHVAANLPRRCARDTEAVSMEFLYVYVYF